jgi:hypothetical protein
MGMESAVWRHILGWRAERDETVIFSECEEIAGDMVPIKIFFNGENNERYNI